MALERLTSEHWLDIREAVQRRLKEVSAASTISPEARNEQARRVNSLKEALGEIEGHCRLLTFEEDQLNF